VTPVYPQARLPAELAPIGGVEVIRVGPPADGGYVLTPSVIPAADHLICLGLSDDWRFEADFLELHDVPLTAYDHTVNRTFWLKRRLARLLAGSLPGRSLPETRSRATASTYRHFFDSGRRTHVPMMVGYDGTGSASLATILESVPSDRRVFLKCDIEGWEWRITSDLVALSSRLVGLAIEFHDVDLHLDRLLTLVRDLSDFEIIHTQANNFAGVSPSGVPMVIEMTFIHRKLLPNEGRTTNGSAVTCYPNDPTRPPVSINFESASD